MLCADSGSKTATEKRWTEIHNLLSTDRLRKVQSNLCLRAPFFRPSGQKNRYIDPCTKPLYNGNFLLSPRWPLKGGLTVVLQVPKSLTFKTRLRAKPFLWKWGLFAWDFHTNSFTLSLALKQRLEATGKWTIYRTRNKCYNLKLSNDD